MTLVRGGQMSIDLHSHYLPAEAARLAAQRLDMEFDYRRECDDVTLMINGHQLSSIPAALVDIDQQLVDLEGGGLEGRALMPPPFLLGYSLPPERGAIWSRVLNEGTMAAASGDPDRLFGFATVPLQAPRLAVDELAYAVEQLGARGVEIASHAAGCELDDDTLLPFFEAAAAYDLPVLVHPHDVAGLSRMRRHELRNLVGNPFETTLVAARLIFGGVLDRVKGLRVILSHGGGATPFLVGRLAHGWRVRLGSQPEAPEGHSFDSLVRGLYFDTVLFDVRALRYLAEVVSADRIVLGTDYPFDMSEAQPLEFLNKGLPKAQVRTILDTGSDLVRA